MRAFNSVESLNEFLASVGLPGLTDEQVEQAASGKGYLELNFNDRPDADEIAAKLRGEPLVGEQAQSEGTIPKFLSDLFGSVGADEVLEEALIPQSKFDAYIELSCDQIALLTRQRDEARADAEREVKDHILCHETQDEQLHEMRIVGHMESLAADQFNQPYDILPASYQQMLRLQAEATIENLDAIRAQTQG